MQCSFDSILMTTKCYRTHPGNYPNYEVVIYFKERAKKIFTTYSKTGRIYEEGFTRPESKTL